MTWYVTLLQLNNMYSNSIMKRREFIKFSIATSTIPLWYKNALAAESITMQAAWINDAEFAGYFIAIDEGLYLNEGLKVNYLSGGPDVIPESSIVTGKADLALTTPDTTIKAIADQGAKFKIIGAQYQKNPIGIVSLKSNPIESPKDLIGKTLAVPPVNVISVEAMLEINNIERSKVNIVPYSYDPTPLIKGNIDASLDFTTNVPYTINMLGEQANHFLLYDFGFTIYNDTVVVTEDVLKTKRKQLVSWLRASRKGWEVNFKDPNLYPPKWKETWFKGTGRSIENEIYFNNAQKPIMESPNGIFSMSEEDIAKNLEAIGRVGIKGKREMFDTSLLEEI